jgi:hypothetical protein
MGVSAFWASLRAILTHHQVNRAMIENVIPSNEERKQKAWIHGRSVSIAFRILAMAPSDAFRYVLRPKLELSGGRKTRLSRLLSKEIHNMLQRSRQDIADYLTEHNTRTLWELYESLVSDGYMSFSEDQCVRLDINPLRGNKRAYSAAAFSSLSSPSHTKTQKLQKVVKEQCDVDSPHGHDQVEGPISSSKEEKKKQAIAVGEETSMTHNASATAVASSLSYVLSSSSSSLTATITESAFTTSARSNDVARCQTTERKPDTKIIGKEDCAVVDSKTCLPSVASVPESEKIVPNGVVDVPARPKICDDDDDDDDHDDANSDTESDVYMDTLTFEELIEYTGIEEVVAD